MTYNEYYDALKNLAARFSEINERESVFVGVSYFGVRRTYYEDLQKGVWFESIRPFQTILHTNSKYHNSSPYAFCLKKDGTPYVKATTYGWNFFRTKQDAEDYLSASKQIFKQYFLDCAKISQERADSIK